MSTRVRRWGQRLVDVAVLAIAFPLVWLRRVLAAWWERRQRRAAQQGLTRLQERSRQ